MFDLIFSTVSAMTQVAAFRAALTCWGSEGLLVGRAVYWRLHAVRVLGRAEPIARARQLTSALASLISAVITGLGLGSASTANTHSDERRRTAPY